MSKRFHGIEKIISGGQTGVDRGALDAAIDFGVSHGGSCPKGRLAEDGPISPKYKLTELDSTDYAIRTKKNVMDSDGTLLLYQGRLRGGTALTNRYAKELGKPLLRIRFDLPIKYSAVLLWLTENEIKTLNIAGPRKSGLPDAEQLTYQFLKKLFSQSASILKTFD
ncbi:MAG: putative molybdenum carrier protein [Planctomycetales bacterium]|nr:putative molybdenum carrier protein [Planctomycetales bacterium]